VGTGFGKRVIEMSLINSLRGIEQGRKRWWMRGRGREREGDMRLGA